MSRTRNYNNWIFQQYSKYVGNSVMDVGCGHGTFVDFIKNKRNVLLIETSQNAISGLKRKYKKMKNISILNADLSSDFACSKIKKEKLDTIICLNVLEHIKNDNKTIKNFRRCLSVGGKLILFVPASKLLYGSLDKNLGHYRRYNRPEINKMLEKNGFKILKSKYINLIGFFSWFLYSRILRKKTVKVDRILLYDKLFVPIASMIEKCIQPPFGQSLLVIAEAN
jgi:SAM-dependent methyltransferase